MVRQDRRASGQTNTLAWMISYADMTTILLAMFIVLSTLGRDQTGVSLYNGTGSYLNAMSSFGLPGLFQTSRNAIPLEDNGPHYLYDVPEDQRKSKGTGGGRVIDGEEEHLQSFLNELKRRFSLERMPRQSGKVVIDVYVPLNHEPPYFKAQHNGIVNQVKPLLEQAGYRIYLVVWSPTPAPSAWTRVTREAWGAAAELVGAGQFDEAARQRLIPLGEPWRYRDIRRPAFSFMLVKQR